MPGQPSTLRVLHSLPEASDPSKSSGSLNTTDGKRQNTSLRIYGARSYATLHNVSATAILDGNYLTSTIATGNLPGKFPTVYLCLP